jgi:hypothetical protein
MMYDCYMIVGEEFKNVVKDGKVIGYQFGLRIPFYSSIVLSMVGDSRLKVDGQTIPDEKTSITLRGRTFPKPQMENEPYYRWEFGEVGMVTVAQPGGLPPGEHTIDIRLEVLIGFVNGGLFGHDIKKLKLTR